MTGTGRRSSVLHAVLIGHIGVQLAQSAQLFGADTLAGAAAAARAHIADDIDLYCLRHTFCTDLQRKGVPLNVAKEHMGHADITTTANIYTHSTPDVLETARSLIDSF